MGRKWKVTEYVAPECAFLDNDYFEKIADMEALKTIEVTLCKEPYIHKENSCI